MTRAPPQQSWGGTLFAQHGECLTDEAQVWHRGSEPVAHARDAREPGLRAVGVAVAVGIDAADRPAAAFRPDPGRAAAVARAQDAVEPLGALALAAERDAQPIAGIAARG